MAQNPRDISALFQVETDNRPSSGLRVEDALAAFKRAGVDITEARQHLARPYGARYCMGALAGGPDVAVSVCEYIDPTAAQNGAAESRKILLKNREVHVHGSTSLTVREIKPTPENDKIAKRLFDTFDKI